ncbi:Alpha/beta hydrolase [Prauserella sp. Am3]|nr:Alpha/beta hydrolase [Prauserella sp. Am3]
MGSDSTGDMAFPPDGAAPQQVKAWWDGLSGRQRKALSTEHGDVVGRLDGVPVADRDRANRVRFAEQRAELLALRTELDEGDDERARIDRIVPGLVAIRRRLEEDPGPGRPGAYLIDFCSDDDGLGVVAIGDPDTADYVVTNVPGCGSGLENMGAELDRSDAVFDRIRQLSRRTTVSVVTWVGYDAPAHVFAAAGDSYAEDAAALLRDFQDGLRATHRTRSYNTVIGHSYGSTVAGYAARDGLLDADALVFVGSPGVGVDTASQLYLPAGAEVYATTAQHDVIRATPDFIHGRQPIADEFGAVEFESDPGSDGSWFTVGLSTKAHVEYWNMDSASLRNMARIALGRKPEAVPDAEAVD